MKILFLQEYIRENHMKRMEDGSFKNVFFSTKGGSILKKLIEEGLQISKNEYYIDYAYSLVPKVVSRDKFGRAIKYKPPTQKEANEEYKYLYERIVKEKPDIIIPTGSLGCKALLGRTAITTLRGIPEKVNIELPSKQGGSRDNNVEIESNLEKIKEELEAHKKAYPPSRVTGAIQKEREDLEARLKACIEDQEGDNEGTHTCWVLPMYSMEYMLVNPSIQNLIEADFVTLKKFVDRGESAFRASPVEYEFVDNIERVREIFTKEVKEHPIVSWDLETNTLRPELPGAKPLVISIAFTEGTGCTIPLEHKDFTWDQGDFYEVYELIKDFVADPDIIKVGHNIQFDIRFLMLTKGFTQFRNHRDTKLMYYLLVNQNVEDSLALSDMAYELTDMGGYDKPLEEYKKKYIEDYVAKEKNRIEKLKEEHKREMNIEKENAKKEGRKPNLIKKKFPKVEPPRNEVDGSDFNYEWIPLKEELHPYASGDVDACLRIHNKLDAIGSKEENKRVRDLYTRFYPELVVTLAETESNGLKVDLDYNTTLIEAYKTEQERLIEEVRKFDSVKQLEEEHKALYLRGLEEFRKPVAERDDDVVKLRNKYKDKLKFNPNAPNDLRKVLYEKTGIRPPFNKEHVVDSAIQDGIPENELEWYHYKANKDTLEHLKDNYEEVAPLADMLLTYSLVKTRGQNFTYKLRERVNNKGFIHGTFNPAGTATTRLSSRNPNLQQIPRKIGDPKRFDYKYPIKRMFVSRFKGGALFQLDYSSLESRILALAANDEQMTESFLSGGDIHKDTASLVFGVPFDKVTDDQRNQAKSTTFGNYCRFIS